MGTGDFDGDGIADLAVADETAGLRWYRGFGNGTWDRQWSYTVDGSCCLGNNNKVTVADMNNDGHDDLVFVYSDDVRVYLNDGTGTSFAKHVVTTFHFSSNPYSVVPLDYTGDGVLDLMVVGRDGTYYRAMSFTNLDGDGTTWVPVNIYRETSTDYLLKDVAVIYADDDDVPDVLTMYQVPSWWSFNGTAWIEHSLPNLQAADTVTVGDVTGDGVDDIVYNARFSNNLTLAAGLTGGAFATPIVLNEPSYLNTDLCIGRFASGIPNGIVSAGPYNNVTLLQYVTGAWTSTVVAPASTTAHRYLACGDWNDDGFTDLAYDDLTSVVTVLNDGAGSLSAEPVRVTTDVVSPSDIAVGDVTGDGRAEIFVATVDLRVSRLLMYNPATNERTVLYTAPDARDGGFHAIDVGDVNGDGLLDLVGQRQVGCCEDEIVVYLGTGNPSAPFADVAIVVPDSLRVKYLYVVDVDRDGHLDILYDNARSSYAIRWNKGNGTGLFEQPYRSVGIPGYTGYYRLSDIGDVDGDGYVDLLSDDSKKWRRNQQDGTFSDRINLVSDAEDGYTGDVNSDGLLDSCKATTGGFECVLNIEQTSGNARVTGTLASAHTPCVGMRVSVVDVDGDGDTDLLGHCYSGAVVDAAYVVWFEQLAGGTWAESVELTTGRFTGALYLAFGNLGGTHATDLVVATSDGFLGWWENPIDPPVTPAPTPMPTAPQPTAAPTAPPTSEPTTSPTPMPTTPLPTPSPTASPTPLPTASPTLLPTPAPTRATPLPTAAPTNVTPSPTASPTTSPTPLPPSPSSSSTSPSSTTESTTSTSPSSTTSVTSTSPSPTGETERESENENEAGGAAGDATADKTGSDSESSSATVIGIAAGAAVSLVLLALLAFAGLRRRRERAAARGRFGGLAVGGSQTAGTGFSTRGSSSHRSRAGSRVSRSRAGTQLAPLPPPQPIAVP
jgi:hypothetical protein